MRILFSALLFFGYAQSAIATVDGHDRAYIVVQNVQDDEEFFVERAPIIGCYGLEQGARLAQFTAPYMATSNIGCGGIRALDNINALSCAKEVAAEESADFRSFSKITLDISACAAKNNPKFITMVRTAAKLNFPQSNKNIEVQLTLIK